MPTFYEFFAGGGMARAGLGSGWECLFANDIDPRKAAAYRDNWGDGALHVGDIKKLDARRLSGEADLAWGSFPCQDLSLAGVGAGLNGSRSGAFWGFQTIVHSLKLEGWAPKLLVLENVCGTLTSHGGRDFVEIGRALENLGYDFGALVIDAALFLPQSRPRLFILAARSDMRSSAFAEDGPTLPWHPRALRKAYGLLPPHLRKRWIWWRLPSPPHATAKLIDLTEDEPTGVRWHSESETQTLLAMMSPANRFKVEEAKRTGLRAVGAIYKRTRRDAAGEKVQRAEVRFDDVAGCLRTPAGGSSRQTIMLIENGRIRTRLLSPREGARLMGLPETYKLPANYNEAYHLVGDGVVAPVVRFLSVKLLQPMLAVGPAEQLIAAE